jgi:hypothetical protein
VLVPSRYPLRSWGPLISGHSWTAGRDWMQMTAMAAEYEAAVMTVRTAAVQLDAAVARAQPRATVSRPEVFTQRRSVGLRVVVPAALVLARPKPRHEEHAETGAQRRPYCQAKQEFHRFPQFCVTAKLCTSVCGWACPAELFVDGVLAYRWAPSVLSEPTETREWSGPFQRRRGEA